MIGDKGLAGFLAAAVCTPQMTAHHSFAVQAMHRRGQPTSNRLACVRGDPGTLGTNGAVARIAGHRLDTVEGGAPVLDFLGACWS